MNGRGELPLGKLEPQRLADDLRAAYLKPGSGKGQLMLRTTKDNNIVFKTAAAYAQSTAEAAIYSRTLSQLSRFLTNNRTIQVAKKTFPVWELDVKIITGRMRLSIPTSSRCKTSISRSGKGDHSP